MATSSGAIVAQKAPFAVELRAGETYAWGACGRSSSQPFCDGSHEVANLTRVLFRAEQDHTAYMRGRKTSQGRSFCDSSHHRL